MKRKFIFNPAILLTALFLSLSAFAGVKLNRQKPMNSLKGRNGSFAAGLSAA
jgi:hypothetical protein